MSGKTQTRLSKDINKELLVLKAIKGLNSISDVIEYLYNEYKKAEAVDNGSE